MSDLRPYWTGVFFRGSLRRGAAQNMTSKGGLT